MPAPNKKAKWQFGGKPAPYVMPLPGFYFVLGKTGKLIEIKKPRVLLVRGETN